jgi:hypothetical protein
VDCAKSWRLRSCPWGVWPLPPVKYPLAAFNFDASRRTQAASSVIVDDQLKIIIFVLYTPSKLTGPLPLGSAMGTPGWALALGLLIPFLVAIRGDNYAGSQIFHDGGGLIPPEEVVSSNGFLNVTLVVNSYREVSDQPTHAVSTLRTHHAHHSENTPTGDHRAVAPHPPCRDRRPPFLPPSAVRVHQFYDQGLLRQWPWLDPGSHTARKAWRPRHGHPHQLPR